MANVAARTSYADYVAGEAAAAEKHEYLRGEVRAMAGGSPEHGRLAVSFARHLGNALGDKPCVVYSSDVRVRIADSDRSTYPDLSVVCGAAESAEGDPHAIVNPSVIVEVLSDTTEADDRGEKFAHYRRLASLREYVLVSQRALRVEVFRRTELGWTLHEAGPGEQVTLESLGVRVSVDDVYRDPRAAHG